MSLFFRNSKQTIKSATIGTTAYTLTPDDNIYIAQPGQTVTLPDPATCIGQTYHIKLGATHSGSGDNVTINVAVAGNLIEGSATHTLSSSWAFHRFVAGKDSAGNPTWMFIV